MSVETMNQHIKPIKALLVEDDEDLIDIASELLELAGCSVTAVATPEEATACLTENLNFELLFTDYRFPSPLTGIDLADQVEALIPNIKVIVATGMDSQSIQLQTKKNYQVISKPYSLDLLRSVVKRLFPVVFQESTSIINYLI